MLSFRRKGSCFLVLAAAACGGSSFTAAPTTGDEGGAAEGGPEGGASEGGGSVDGAGAEGGGGDAGAPRDGGGGTADGATDAPATQDASDGPAMPCPLVRGTYTVTLGGVGCGDLNPAATQCIRQSAGSCTIDFISSVSGGGSPAINGSATLGADGAFGTTTLTEGSVDRTGCTGLWNPVTSTMTVDCGGVGSSQSCVAKLARTGIVPVCN